MAGSGATSSWQPTSRWHSSSLWRSSRGTSCPRRPRSGAPAARSRRDASPSIRRTTRSPPACCPKWWRTSPAPTPRKRPASCSHRPAWRRADKYFRAQMYGLLGAAYENALRPKDAATAYESAAGAALYPFLRAQFLSDAGRGWLATGDTAKALVAYRMIAEKLDSTNAAGEAKVRIGELTKGGGHR